MNSDFGNEVMFFKNMMEVLGFGEVEITIDQNLYPIPAWAEKQVVRESGLVEDICEEHGVGHPNAGWLKLHDPDGSRGFRVHGCCLCCCDDKTKKRIRSELNGET